MTYEERAQLAENDLAQILIKIRAFLATFDSRPTDAELLLAIQPLREWVEKELNRYNAGHPAQEG